ncbi:hypothetical protein HYPSUDRAFT_65970 [Hypholoma sublateritium FD-334 SS-4]|uniref:Uncharacterized protein n=1 Tax=Hypholoma sublateritium (strain FD-334 SS-4) TaxID=945553 RepID=A0A0D2MJI9_HYPSF|nr:hypothetical protein HYPSUDRAFT_65970 [Hypholoma sublateritium FD-334 SS-4]
MRPKYTGLARLQKANRWTSANYRFQVPGLPDPLLGGPNTNQRLDLSHPASNIRLANFPKAASHFDAFSARMYPIALLKREASPFPSIPFMTWRERVQAARETGFSGVRTARSSVLCLVDEHGVPRPYRSGEQVYPKDDHNTLQIPGRNSVPRPPHLESRLQRAARRVPMSFTVSTSKKRMGPHAYIRAKIVKRLRGVIDLIVSRGAHVVTKETSEPEVCLSEDESGRKWSMQGWMYVFYPTTDIYRMPLPELITVVRECLTQMNEKAIKMENTWLAESLLNDRVQIQPIHKRLSEPVPTTAAARITAMLAGNTPHCDPIKNTDDTTETRNVSFAKSQPRVSTTKSLSVSPTGEKSHKAWQSELKAGLALLANRLPTKGEEKPGPVRRKL